MSSHRNWILAPPTLALTLALFSPIAQPVERWSNFQRNPDRHIPRVGMAVTEVIRFFGEPALTQGDINNSGKEVWDYSTFRVFITAGVVQHSSLW